MFEVAQRLLAAGGREDGVSQLPQELLEQLAVGAVVIDDKEPASLRGRERRGQYRGDDRHQARCQSFEEGQRPASGHEDALEVADVFHDAELGGAAGWSRSQ